MNYNVIALVFFCCLHGAEGGALLGYWEDWVDVKWWDNNIPGNCLMGCFEPAAYLTASKPYSNINYGFTFLTETPSPDQVSCDSTETSGSGPCPVWDGKAIYLAAAGKNGAQAITPDTTAPTPGIVSIMEAGRMAKMHPDGPKRFKISLGGWSDFARMGDNATAAKVAKLAAKLVLWTFADGVDLDFEHLTPYSAIADEFGPFSTLVATLKTELETTVKSGWVQRANDAVVQLQADYAKLEPWQQMDMQPYYDTNIKYCKEIAANAVPLFEVTWTTRFNAFLPKGNPWNYLLPDSPKPNVTFATDYEGDKIYPNVGRYLDAVNIMAYDAGNIKLNFTTIMDNFVRYGSVPKSKIMIGFEPGEQAAGGTWEGLAMDTSVVQYAEANGYGGAFIWSGNPSPTTNPDGRKLCPEVAHMANGILKPSWQWGPIPNFTKCDPTTGWATN